MSIFGRKKKFITLDGVRVYFDRKTNTIQITSTDKRIVGEPFKISLNQGTETEQTLRNLLLEEGVITEEDTPGLRIPKRALYPTDFKTLRALPWNKIPIGLGVDSEIVYWDVVKEPHSLIVGATGSGKSVYQRSLILHTLLHSDEWRFMGIDLKKVELSPYKKYTKVVLDIGDDLRSGVEVIEAAYKEMMKRYEAMESQGFNYFKDLKDDKDEELPAIMVMLDEASMFLSLEGIQTDEGIITDGLHMQAQHLVGTIARLGRAAGIHLAISTQRPDATFLKSELKANLDFRVAAGRLSPTPSNLTLGTDKATQLPGDIRGRALIRSYNVDYTGPHDHDNIIEFQMYYAPQDFLEEAIQPDDEDKI